MNIEEMLSSQESLIVELQRQAGQFRNADAALALSYAISGYRDLLQARNESQARGVQEVIGLGAEEVSGDLGFDDGSDEEDF